MTKGYSPSETQLSVSYWYFSTCKFAGSSPPTANKKSESKLAKSFYKIATFICTYSGCSVIKVAFGYFWKGANRISSDVTLFRIVQIKAQIYWLFIDSSTCTKLKLEVERSNSLQRAFIYFWDLCRFIISTEHIKITTVCDRATSINLCSIFKSKIEIFASIFDLSSWISDDWCVIPTVRVENENWRVLWPGIRIWTSTFYCWLIQLYFKQVKSCRIILNLKN